LLRIKIRHRRVMFAQNKLTTVRLKAIKDNKKLKGFSGDSCKGKKSADILGGIGSGGASIRVIKEKTATPSTVSLGGKYFDGKELDFNTKKGEREKKKAKVRNLGR